MVQFASKLVNLQKWIVSTVLKHSRRYVWSSSAPDLSSAARFRCIICRPIMSLAIIFTLLSHRPLPCHLISSHHLPPTFCATTLPPLSLLQPPSHPGRSRCAIRCSLRALVTLSAHCRHSHHGPLLAITALVAPSAARSCRPTASTTTSPRQ